MKFVWKRLVLHSEFFIKKNVEVLKMTANYAI